MSDDKNKSNIYEKEKNIYEKEKEHDSKLKSSSFKVRSSWERRRNTKIIILPKVDNVQFKKVTTNLQMNFHLRR